MACTMYNVCKYVQYMQVCMYVMESGFAGGKCSEPPASSVHLLEVALFICQYNSGSSNINI